MPREINSPPARLLAGNRGEAGDERKTHVSPGADDINRGDDGKPLDGCSSSRGDRLVLANRVRMAQADVKRRLKSGELRFDELMADLPDYCMKIAIGKLVQWLPYVKGTRARRELAVLKLDSTMPIGWISPDSRRRLGAQMVRFQRTRVTA